MIMMMRSDLWLWVVALTFICLAGGATVVRGGSEYVITYTWKVTFGTINPMGVPQQGILINNQFPGPSINGTTNGTVQVTVENALDEPILFTWHGIQQRGNSWQDGVAGTNCPILPGQKWTYKWAPTDQVGTFFYYPSTALHRAGGAYGIIRIDSNKDQKIPLPYAPPADDFAVTIGDWFIKGQKFLRETLDIGQPLPSVDGVVINGRGPKSGGKPLFTMETGKTYKYRICNTGVKTSLNFRIQAHKMKLVELEGSHVNQNMYDSLDIHVGQCMAVLVTANQPPKEYFLFASTRFLEHELVGMASVTYLNGKGPAVPHPPPAPIGWGPSIDQFRSFRQNLTANAGSLAPQGTSDYGKKKTVRTIRLANVEAKQSGKLKFGINGVSHVDLHTPVKLAEYFNVADEVFRYDSIADQPRPESSDVSVEPNVLNVTHKSFVEIIFENKEKLMQSWHMDGYSFFTVALEEGVWGPEKRKGYNLKDAPSVHTVHVFPNCWAAVLVSFDNAGMWNVRSEMQDRRFLGQQLYLSIRPTAKSLKEELNIPDNAILCGIVQGLTIPKPNS